MKKIFLLLIITLLTQTIFPISIEDLSKSDEWHNLLLDDPYGKGFVTDYNQFFACGEKNYKKEILYLINNQSEKMYERYPARYECISRNLDLKIPFLENNMKVKDYLEKNNFNTLSIALVEPFNQTVKSVFGHAFIFLSNDDKNIENGVTINLYAHIENLSSFEVIEKGLDGSLIGYFDFKKVSDTFENYLVKLEREIIDYQTTLTKEEVKKILLMVFELQNAPIDYQFIKRNCVNGTIHLLDYALGNLEIRKNYPGILMPNLIPQILKENNLIKSITTYSPVITQLGHEISYQRIPEFNERKKAWDSDGWKIKGYDHKQGLFVPIKDNTNRPFYFNNNCSYLGFGTTFNPIKLNNQKPTLNIEGRFLLAEDWERIFSTKKLCELNLAKFKFHYRDLNNFNFSNITLWEKNTYPKMMMYHIYPTKKLFIGADNNFEKEELKAFLSYGIGISIGTDHTLLYTCLTPSLIICPIGINIDIDSGAMIYSSFGNIRFCLKYPIAAYPKKVKRKIFFNLSSSFRINDSFLIKGQYNFINKEISIFLRYYFSPWKNKKKQ